MVRSAAGAVGLWGRRIAIEGGTVLDAPGLSSWSCSQRHSLDQQRSAARLLSQPAQGANAQAAASPADPTRPILAGHQPWDRRPANLRSWRSNRGIRRKRAADREAVTPCQQLHRRASRHTVSASSPRFLADPAGRLFLPRRFLSNPEPPGGRLTGLHTPCRAYAMSHRQH
jgi:hypothetical protein